jgi:tetratricopeptide (TPR) repeat protein
LVKEEVVMRVPALCVALLLGAVSVSAQGDTPQKLFEAGQYDQAIQALQALQQPAQAAPPTSPAQTFLAGQIYLKLNQNDAAKQAFAKLAASPDPIWQSIGQSAVALVDNNLDEALNKINQASSQVQSAMPPAAAAVPPSAAMPKASENFHVAYQMGLVKSRRNDWDGAAQAFERAAQIDPAFAYAQYYAGMAYSHLKRPDKTSQFFDHFLTLAPKAPERPAVLSIMRTIRGN